MTTMAARGRPRSGTDEEYHEEEPTNQRRASRSGWTKRMLPLKPAEAGRPVREAPTPGLERALRLDDAADHEAHEDDDDERAGDAVPVLLDELHSVVAPSPRMLCV